MHATLEQLDSLVLVKWHLFIDVFHSDKFALVNEAPDANLNVGNGKAISHVHTDYFAHSSLVKLLYTFYGRLHFHPLIQVGHINEQ